MGVVKLNRAKWRNRRAGEQSTPPETSEWEIFADLLEKKRQGKLKMEGGKVKLENE